MNLNDVAEAEELLESEVTDHDDSSDHINLGFIDITIWSTKQIQIVALPYTPKHLTNIQLKVCFFGIAA